MRRDRVTVQEAAARLGVKDDAVRKRIQRGTLEHEKGPDGRVYVYVDAVEDASYVGQGSGAAWDGAKARRAPAAALGHDEAATSALTKCAFS